MKKVVLLFLLCFPLINNAQDPSLVFFKLNMTSPGSSYSTDVYFNDFATSAFDVGFDAQFIFTPPPFVIYTTLLDGSDNEALVLQAVNTLSLANSIIPVGVNASSNQELTFFISTNQLPPTTEVYLDDVVENTSTLLTSTNYVVNPGTTQNGTGRFFLRIIDETLITEYTFDGTWSPEDPNGIATTNDSLIIESGNATINSNTVCNNVIVRPGAGLTVNSGTTLEASNGLVLESSSTSYSSLILDGTINGVLNYERHVNINGSGTTGSNDLISAPLTGQSFDEFAAANPNIFTDGTGTLYLFGPFNKTTGEFDIYNNTTTTPFIEGVGYRAASNDNTAFTFSGIAQNGPVSVPVQNGGPVNQEWNLIGNPYPSYMDAASFLFNNLGTFNPTTAGIWGYDGTAINGWTLVNLANVALNPSVAPGQGFFVSAASNGTINFDPSWRITGTSDDYIQGRNTELLYMRLQLSSGTDAYNSDIFFDPNGTSDFDPGYDASHWGDNLPDFALYSTLPEGNTTDKLILQTLNYTALSNSTIPLGVKADQGEQLTFSIETSTLPDTVNVYLDDILNNSSTLLNNSDYMITADTDLDGIGRFYLRYFEDALSTTTHSLNQLDIFAINDTNEIIINGQLNDETAFNLFDIQGRKVLSVSLDQTLIQNRINVAHLNAGVYIVRVQNNRQETSTKVILD